ncbi:MAG: PilN domain-containing protein [Betaproteobacteria bacterium]|nr:PilN domain-containing protein [Betaproteobacteria bacterium]
MSQQINLFNPIFRKKSFSATSSTSILYAVIAAVVATALFAVYEDRRVGELVKNSQAADRTLKDLSARRDKLNAELTGRKPNTQLEAEITGLESVLKGRNEIIVALQSAGIGTTTGFSEFMRAFSRQDVNGLWLTGFDIAGGGTQLTLTGRALNADMVPGYLKRLNAEPPMQGRQFAAMRISQPVRAPESAKSDKADKGTPAPKAQAPLFLEFTLSSSELVDGTGAQAFTQQPLAEAPR